MINVDVVMLLFGVALVGSCSYAAGRIHAQATWRRGYRQGLTEGVKKGMNIALDREWFLGRKPRTPNAGPGPNTVIMQRYRPGLLAARNAGRHAVRS